jgi:hypothetical protein
LETAGRYYNWCQGGAQLRLPTLTKTNHNAIPIYAQEPLFNKPDKQHLASLGITVIEKPGVWEQIGSE